MVSAWFIRNPQHAQISALALYDACICMIRAENSHATLYSHTQKMTAHHEWNKLDSRKKIMLTLFVMVMMIMLRTGGLRDSGSCLMRFDQFCIVVIYDAPPLPSMCTSSVPCFFWRYAAGALDLSTISSRSLCNPELTADVRSCVDFTHLIS